LGIINILHFFDPEKVVLGGGMIAAGDDFLNRIRWFVKDQAFKECAQGEDICFATLGNDAGILGAAIAARQMVLKN
jgi:glucokinase